MALLDPDGPTLPCAVPPLVTDIDLSLDDRFLYVACWGTGELRQYDVSDPRNLKLAGSVHIGGITRKTPHSNGKTFAGGPQMLEISRDGKRVYWTNSLYSTWDTQFYPEGVPAAQVMANVGDDELDAFVGKNLKRLFDVAGDMDLKLFFEQHSEGLPGAIFVIDDENGGLARGLNWVDKFRIALGDVGGG